MTAYSEDNLVQQTTAEYLQEQLGWESIYAYNNEDFGPNSLLGRSSDREVVLIRTLRSKLQGLNPNLPVVIACAVSFLGNKGGAECGVEKLAGDNLLNRVGFGQAFGLLRQITCPNLHPERFELV